MKIIKDVNKLHSVAPAMEFANNKNKIEALVRNMTDTYYNWCQEQCQGLAAIQIGINESCILLQYDITKSTKPIVVFNPKVLFKIGFRLSFEGCESEGSRRFYVWRPLLCRVSYQLPDGTLKKEWLKYKKARIFCHEYDHTKGIMLRDKGVFHIDC